MVDVAFIIAMARLNLARRAVGGCGFDETPLESLKEYTNRKIRQTEISQSFYPIRVNAGWIFFSCNCGFPLVIEEVSRLEKMDNSKTIKEKRISYIGLILFLSNEFVKQQNGALHSQQRNGNSASSFIKTIINHR